MSIATLANPNEEIKSDCEAFIAICEHRMTTEFDVLALAAAGPRQSASILARAGVGIEHFSEDDAKCFFLSIVEWAGRPTGSPRSREQIARMTIVLIKSIHRYDHGNKCEQPVASTWGPEAICRLLYRELFDAKLLRAKAAELLAAHQFAVTVRDSHYTAWQGRRRVA